MSTTTAGTRRIIAVFTGTRAEYGLLRSVMLGLERRTDCRLQVIASGSHLSHAWGDTVEEIEKDGYGCLERVAILDGDDSAVSVCTAMGRAVERYALALERLNPDLVVLLGDRYEAFAMAAAATMCRVPVAHLHGGEATEGALDETFRHAITKMSHLHFTSCDVYRQRVLQLGEAPDHVHTVGSLGVENTHSVPLMSESEIRRELGLDGKLPYILCTMHPETLCDTTPAGQLDGLLGALDGVFDHAVIFTGANADPGGGAINALLQQYVAVRPQCRFFMSLGQRRYFSAVAHAACIIGNSSSGVIEVPSFHVPVIDIGNRQKGRVRAESVLHSLPDKASVAESLAIALSPAYKKKIASIGNPYDVPGTTEAIVRHLCEHPLDGILQKHFYTVAP